MKRWWIVAGCVSGLAACGGGGDQGGAATDQTPFGYAVSQARAQPLEQSCSASVDAIAPPVVPPEPPAGEVLLLPAAEGAGALYSVLETTESRVATSGKTVEVFERESFHDTADCSGDALVSSQVNANGQPVPVMRMTYLNTIASAQVHRLDGSTVGAVVDRVEVAVNSQSGLYDFAFFGPMVSGSQEKQDFSTTATFTINGVSVTRTHEMQAPASVVLGLALLNGEVSNVLPLSDGVFQEVAE